MKGKVISFEESQQLQTGLIEVVDKYCRARGINYFLAYGTLIGAVRHKGHIPWDDDSDIIMPRPDFERFVSEFPETDDYKVITYMDDDGLFYNFARITNKHTYNSRGFKKYHGVNLDIYPIDGVPEEEGNRKEYLNSVYAMASKQYRLILKFLHYDSHYLLPFRKIFLKLMQRFNKKFDGLIQQNDYSNSSFVANLAGEPYHKIYPKQIFEEETELEFDGHKFLAPKAYHEFLTIVYGDYMKLPPEEKRIAYHGGNYYWRD